MVADTRESLAGIPADVERAAAKLEHGRAELESAGIRTRRTSSRRAVENAQDQQSAWRRADLVVEITKGLPDCLGGLDRSQVKALVNELADAALQPGTRHGVVRLTAREPRPAPDGAQARGRPVRSTPATVPRGTPRRPTWSAKAASSNKATELGAPAVRPRGDRAAVPPAPDSTRGRSSPSRSILGSGRRMEVVAAPAGTGKSRLAGAIHDVWTRKSAR